MGKNFELKKESLVNTKKKSRIWTVVIVQSVINSIVKSYFVALRQNGGEIKFSFSNSL